MDRDDKYWICEDCAEKKDWKLGDHAMTVIMGLCGHCERKDETVIIPQRDFRKPRE